MHPAFMPTPHRRPRCGAARLLTPLVSPGRPSFPPVIFCLRVCSRSRICPSGAERRPSARSVAVRLAPWPPPGLEILPRGAQSRPPVCTPFCAWSPSDRAPASQSKFPLDLALSAPRARRLCPRAPALPGQLSWCLACSLYVRLVLVFSDPRARVAGEPPAGAQPGWSSWFSSCPLPTGTSSGPPFTEWVTCPRLQPGPRYSSMLSRRRGSCGHSASPRGCWASRRDGCAPSIGEGEFPVLKQLPDGSLTATELK